MGHEPFPSHISRRIDLQKYQVPLTLCQQLLERIKIGKPLIILPLRHPYQLDLIRYQLLSMIILIQGIKRLDMSAFCQSRLSLIY